MTPIICVGETWRSARPVRPRPRSSTGDLGARRLHAQQVGSWSSRYEPDLGHRYRPHGDGGRRAGRDRTIRATVARLSGAGAAEVRIQYGGRRRPTSQSLWRAGHRRASLRRQLDPEEFARIVQFPKHARP